MLYPSKMWEPEVKLEELQNDHEDRRLQRSLPLKPAHFSR